MTHQEFMEIEKACEKVPHLRFGQIIENFKSSELIGTHDLFYIEDSDLVKRLVDYIDTL